MKDNTPADSNTYAKQISPPPSFSSTGSILRLPKSGPERVLHISLSDAPNSHAHVGKYDHRRTRNCNNLRTSSSYEYRRKRVLQKLVVGRGIGDWGLIYTLSPPQIYSSPLPQLSTPDAIDSRTPLSHAGKNFRQKQQHGRNMDCTEYVLPGREEISISPPLPDIENTSHETPSVYQSLTYDEMMFCKRKGYKAKGPVRLLPRERVCARIGGHDYHHVTCDVMTALASQYHARTHSGYTLSCVSKYPPIVIEVEFARSYQSFVEDVQSQRLGHRGVDCTG